MSASHPARALALWIAALALLAHMGLTAGGVWTFGAINYDDPQVIELVRSSGVDDLLTSPNWYAYKPLYFLSLKFDALFGDDMPYVAHVVNLLLHALAALLLVRLLFSIFGSAWVAGAVGVLFAVHPVHVENVAWLSERKDVLSLVFVLWAHFAWRHRRGDGVPWAPALLLLAGGLTKGTVWSYAGVIAVDALVHAPRGGRRVAVKSVLPLLVVGAGGIALDFALAMQSGAAGIEHGVSTVQLAAAMAAVHLRYLWNLVVPAGLSLDYAIDPAGTWGVLAIGGLVLALGALWLLVRGLRRGHAALALAGALWVFGLAPVNNVLPRTAVLMADRYLYVPAIGLYLLIALLLARAVRARGVALGLAAVALVVLCEARTVAFEDSERVWSDALEKVPNSTLARLQRGQAAAADGRYESALADATAALDGSPNRPEWRVRARLLRCAALLGLGETDQLLEAANAAATAARALHGNEMVRDDPRAVRAQAEIFRGQALERLGHTVAAIDAYQRAVSLDDDNWSAHFNYGTLLAGTRNEESLDEALVELRRALDLNPGYLEAALQVATVYGRRGNKPRALQVLELAEARHGRAPDLLYARAQIHLGVGNDWAEARRILRELREVDPHDPKGKRLEADISVAIGNAHLRKGRAERDGELFRKAIGHFDEAVQIMPDHWQAHLYAGDALAERGLYREARERYRSARRIATRERWLESVIARAGVLHAAIAARDAESSADVAAAARIMAGVLQRDIRRLELGFAPLEEELAYLRRLGPILESGRMPEADHAAALLAAAALLVTGDEVTALRDLRRTFGRLGAAEREPALLDAALLLRAMLYLREGALDAAREDYELLARRRPDDVLPPLRLLQIDLRAAYARYQIALGMPGDEQAVAEGRKRVTAIAERIRAFADAHPASGTAGLLAVQAEINLERWIEALRRLNAMEQRFEANPNPSVYRGFNMVYVAEYTKTRDRKLIEEASRALDRAMALDRRDVRTLMDASQLARVAGDLASAVRHAERARALESYQGGPASRLLADLHVALGRKALEGGQVELARKSIQAARLVDPSRAGSWILEGELVLKTRARNRLQQAFELARKAKELEPYNVQANRLLAACHRGSAMSALMQRGMYRAPGKQAGKAYEEWMALDEAERERRQEGFEHMKERLLRQAIYDLEQALVLDPDGEEAEKTRRDLRQLRASDPVTQHERWQRAEEAYRRGRGLQEEGKPIDALYAYLEAVQLRPDHRKAQFLLLQLADALLVGLPTDTPEGRETSEKYLEIAFRALDQLTGLDQNRFAELWYHRGRLHVWIYNSDTTPEAREVSRVAAVRAFQQYVAAHADTPDIDETTARHLRYADAKLKVLRKKAE